MADVGKVLVGIQVPPGKRPDLDAFLAELQYPFVDETDNVVYNSFLTSASAAQTASRCAAV